MKQESGVKTPLRKWTIEEIKLLTDTVNKYQNNNQKAYREVAQLTNRKTKAVEMYHYNNIKNKDNNTAINIKKNKEFLKKEEEDVIKKDIKLYPHNLQYAFEMSATELNKTKTSIANLYYNKIKKNNTLITVGSEKGFTKNNIKNQHKSKETGTVIQDLQPLQWIIKELLNLTTQERKFITLFLTDTSKLLS